MSNSRPKLAAIVTTYRKYSHAQHIVDRFLYGYGWSGTHHHPTIAEALTLGGTKLAVDGVVVVGEHGNYPRNEKGQTKYPRWEFFQQIVKVFRASGRVV